MNTTPYTPAKTIDPIAPSIEQPPQTTQAPDTRKILESIWADAAPIPVYDEAGQKRKERVAKLNAAGRGLSVLGDVLGLATGATVKQSEPDRVTPAMLQSYQGYIQNYENRMDNFNYRDFRDRLAKNQLLLQDSYRQEGQDREDARYRDTKDFREKQFGESVRQYEEAPERKQQDYEYQQEQRYKEMDYRHKQTMAEIEARSKYYTSRGQDQGNSISVVLSSGVTKSFTPERYSRMRDLALQNAELIAKQYPHLFEKTGEERWDPEKETYVIDDPLYALKKTAKDDDLIRAYLDIIDKRENWQRPDNWKSPGGESRPEYRGPVRHDAPAAEPTQKTETQQAPNIPTMIQEGRVEDAYDLLKEQGYEDEAIRLFFDEVMKN